MWSEEAPNKYCINKINEGFEDIRTLLACQKFCQAHSSCIGISWTLSGNSGCFLCRDDVLSDATGSYGFYRKPLGTNNVQSTC